MPSDRPRPNPSVDLVIEGLYLLISHRFWPPCTSWTVLHIFITQVKVNDLSYKGMAYFVFLSCSYFGLTFEEPHVNNKPSQVLQVFRVCLAENVVRLVVRINSKIKS